MLVKFVTLFCRAINNLLFPGSQSKHRPPLSVPRRLPNPSTCSPALRDFEPGFCFTGLTLLQGSSLSSPGPWLLHQCHLLWLQSGHGSLHTPSSFSPLLLFIFHVWGYQDLDFSSPGGSHQAVRNFQHYIRPQSANLSLSRPVFIKSLQRSNMV